MDRHGKTPTHLISASQPALDDVSLGRELQRALVRGWEDFMMSDKLRALRAFAALLDSSGQIEPDGRMRLPHPAYDVAALYIGIPFIEELRTRGLFLDSWFPGDVARSEEIVWLPHDIEEDRLARIGARAFRSSILRADGSLVCHIAITFLYLKDSFGFPCPPSLSVIFPSAPCPCHAPSSSSTPHASVR